jgi:hypothetical protein
MIGQADYAPIITLKGFKTPVIDIKTIDTAQGTLLGGLSQDRLILSSATYTTVRIPNN